MAANPILPTLSGGLTIADSARANQNHFKMIFDTIKSFTQGTFDATRSGATGIKNAIGSIFGFLRTPPGEYITFIVFIIILLTGILYLAFSPNSPFRRAGGGGGGGGSYVGPNYFAWLDNLLIKLNIDTSWLYRLRGSNGDGINKVPARVVEGRCDGQQHLEMTTSGKNPVCLNTKLPTVIEWNIDPTVIPEWNLVPQMIKDKLIQERGGTKVYIPWGVVEPEPDPQNPFAKLKGVTNTLAPLCNKAYFEDGSSASALFSHENHQMCQRAILDNKTYGAKRSYESEGTGIHKRPVNRGGNRTCTLEEDD